MKPKARDEFYKWHREQKDVPFNFKEELLRYCEMDVRILRLGCMKFRQIVRGLFNVDPFTCSMTIASMCMYIFRYARE